MNPRSAALETSAGIVLLLLGLGLLGEAGWYGYAHYPRLEESAGSGKTPTPSTSPWRIEGSTEAERDENIRREFAELRELGRRDALWMRIHLYAIAPVGVLLVVLGTWLLTADYRRRSSVSRDSA